MPLGAKITTARYGGRAVLVVPLDGVWCLLAYAAERQPTGAVGPVFLAARKDVKADDTEADSRAHSHGPQ
jgi:hypothetical protein